MDRIEQLLATVDGLLPDTTDGLDLHYLLQSKHPKQLMEKEATGANRSEYLLAQIIEEVGHSPGLMSAIRQWFLLITTSRTNPCTFSELVTLEFGLRAAIGRESPLEKVFLHEDSRIDDRMSGTLIVWVAAA